MSLFQLVSDWLGVRQTHHHHHHHHHHVCVYSLAMMLAGFALAAAAAAAVIASRGLSFAGRLSITMPAEIALLAKALSAVWAAMRAFSSVQDTV